jgi:hypothetical protein
MLKPILLGVEGEAKKIIETYNAGVTFESENKQEFLDGVNKISSSQEFYLQLQEGCEDLAQAFDRKILAEKMFNIMKNIATRES